MARRDNLFALLDDEAESDDVSQLIAVKNVEVMPAPLGDPHVQNQPQTRRRSEWALDSAPAGTISTKPPPVLPINHCNSWVFLKFIYLYICCMYMYYVYVCVCSHWTVFSCLLLVTSCSGD